MLENMQDIDSPEIRRIEIYLLTVESVSVLLIVSKQTKIERNNDLKVC